MSAIENSGTENKKIRARGRSEREVAEDLTASLTAKGIINNLETRSPGASPSGERNIAKHIETARALDPLAKVPFGNVISRTQRHLPNMDAETLALVARTAAGVVSRMGPSVDAAGDYKQHLNQLQRRATKRLGRIS